MYGFLFYILATIPYVPHVLLPMLVLYIFFFRKEEMLKLYKFDRTFLLQIVSFVLIVFVVFLIKSFFCSDRLEFPYFIPIICTFLIGVCLKGKDLKVILYCLVFESIIGVLEYVAGVHTFLPNIPVEGDFQTETLLYYRRVSGLCVGSSTFSAHLLCGIVLSCYLRKQLKHCVLCNLMLLLGMFLSFNRTMLGVTSIFEIVFLFLFLREKKQLTIYSKILLLFFLIFGILLIVWSNLDIIQYQLTRGNSSNVMTGRPKIWHEFWLFIKDNLALGNCGYRTKVDYYSGMIHAHNSYIQLLANVGLIMFLYYMFMIFSRISKSNFLYIFPFFLVSFTQYELFWGISFMDVFLFFFLSYKNRNKSLDNDECYISYG